MLRLDRDPLGIHLMRQGHDLRYVTRVFEDDQVMGIETYGSMVFSSMICRILCTNLLTKTDFPLPVGPEITLVNGWTHGMK